MELKFYLRMEAVNIAQFISDCEDLSTIRGGGLLLLDSPRRLATKFPRLEQISGGGSWALFEFEAATAEEAEQIRNDSEVLFNEDRDLCHATFVVDIAPHTGDFLKDRETVLARNRWRQMRSPAVAVPREPATLPCRTDKVRPGVHQENGEPVSTSVQIRRAYGRKQKQNFYEQQTGIVCPRFVNDFDRLTQDASSGNLNHKMAVIHLDGNGFGKIQNDLCNTAARLQDFDHTLRGLRRGMLRALLEQTVSKEEWTNPDGEHRIETLLWGGDEIIWVVPAWTGLWVLNFFFSHSANWSFPEKDPQSRLLTHGGGVVFCHHKAPVHRITQLAQALTNYAKDAIGHDRPKNVIAYQILESFDHVGRNLEEVIRERLPEGSPRSSLLLQGELIGDVMETAKRLKQQLPRNKIHAVARGFVRKETSIAAALGAQTLQRVPQKAQEEFKGLVQKIGDERMAWVHLAELWDYFPE
jgi:hypothetical protein